MTSGLPYACMRTARIVVACASRARSSMPEVIICLPGTRYCLLMSGAQQIHIQPHRARNARWQLPKERIRSINVRAFTILRPQQAAFLRVLSRIVTREERFEVIVPLVHEVEPALLH